MTPYEILLSESQERMLVIVKKGQEQTVREIFEKWDLPYALVGEVKDDGMMRVLHGGKTVVEIPAAKLADDAPLYSREAATLPPRSSATAEVLLHEIPETSVESALVRLLSHPSIASKRWVWRQYDHMIRLGCTVLPGSDAAVFIVREANKILAATTDCNAIYCRQNPREGARIAIAEAARNLACSGATPVAVTDNLNFGNPHKPENFLQLREAVEGMAEACRAFDTPVTGGNVSLYNESPAAAIDPTPTVGMVGIIADAKHITTSAFKAAGDVIFLLGNLVEETPAQGIGASHYLKVIGGRKAGPPPRLDYDEEKSLHDTLRAFIRMGLVRSAHDCSEGGIAVALAESCIAGKETLSAKVDLGNTGTSPTVALFNESQSRVIISVSGQNATTVQALLAWRGAKAQRIGKVTPGSAPFAITADGKTFEWDAAALNSAWNDTLGALMDSK
jgi:phosphoribosylformylglycinamidine synthase